MAERLIFGEKLQREKPERFYPGHSRLPGGILVVGWQLPAFHPSFFSAACPAEDLKLRSASPKYE